ncbi:hypothetical protein J437_LFUL019578, partial [Ladona fulva]
MVAILNPCMSDIASELNFMLLQDFKYHVKKKALYSLITFGVARDHSTPSPLDPPENLFRIRLVCVLLETCGTYFSHGSSKKKLDCFFVYFQNYFWFKYSHPYWNVSNPFPFGVMFMFKDVLTSLRPKIRLYDSYEDSQKEVGKLETDLRLKLSEIAPDLLNQEENQDEVLSTTEEIEEPLEEVTDASGGLNSVNERGQILNTITEMEEDNDEDEDEVADMNYFCTPQEEVSNSQQTPPV